MVLLVSCLPLLFRTYQKELSSTRIEWDMREPVITLIQSLRQLNLLTDSQHLVAVNDIYTVECHLRNSDETTTMTTTLVMMLVVVIVVAKQLTHQTICLTMQLKDAIEWYNWDISMATEVGYINLYRGVGGQLRRNRLRVRVLLVSDIYHIQKLCLKNND